MSLAETRNGWAFSSSEETDFSSTGGSDGFPKWCGGTEELPTGVWREEDMTNPGGGVNPEAGLSFMHPGAETAAETLGVWLDSNTWTSL